MTPKFSTPLPPLLPPPLSSSNSGPPPLSGSGEKTVRPRLIHILRPIMRNAGLDLAEHWRVPYYLSIQDFLPDDVAIRISKRWCRGLIVPCQELADHLHKTIGVPKALLRVVRPGISVEAIRDPASVSVSAPVSVTTPGRDDVPPVTAAKRPLGGDSVPVIGMAGPLAPSAGLVAFLKAAQKVREQGFDVEFAIAGYPIASGDLEVRRRVERLKLADRVTLVMDPALRSIFWSVLDIYCQPSQVPATGHLLIRAMSCGLPAIGTDVTGLKSLIDPGRTGISVPPNDSDALAKAITSLLMDRERAQSLGAAAQSWAAAEFDPIREARELAELYERT